MQPGMQQQQQYIQQNGMIVRTGGQPQPQQIMQQTQQQQQQTSANQPFNPHPQVAPPNQLAPQPSQLQGSQQHQAQMQ